MVLHDYNGSDDIRKKAKKDAKAKAKALDKPKNKAKQDKIKKAKAIVSNNGIEETKEIIPSDGDEAEKLTMLVISNIDYTKDDVHEKYSHLIGNDRALKFDTPEKRKALCDAWCSHIANGYSKESFPLCDMKTIKKYIKDNASDFPSDKIGLAKRLGRLWWERKGVEGMVNKISFFGEKIWMFNMKNRYGWHDRKEIEHDLGKNAKALLGLGPSQFTTKKRKDEDIAAQEKPIEGEVINNEKTDE